MSVLDPETTGRVEELSLSTLREVWKLSREYRNLSRPMGCDSATHRHIRVKAYSLMVRNHPLTGAGLMVPVVKRFFDGVKP